MSAAMAKSECRSPDSEKVKKYDRQLRLWGDHGQAMLEAAHVCLINASATGTEILKGLILPGIGSFTIVDGAKITGEDVGNNFFLDKDSIGRNRAEVAKRLLMELNSDVRGDAVEESAESILEHNPDFFTKAFTVVIATDLHEKTLLRLSSILWSKSVPLVVCKCYGMIGYLRLQINEHPIIESHPDNEFHDLRLDRPFPALREFVDFIDMDKLTHKEHSHTPYIVILLKALDEWQILHGKGLIPKTFSEKKEFKDIIRKSIRPPESQNHGEENAEAGARQGQDTDEENFDEAIKAVNTALGHTQVPSRIEELFNDPCCEKLDANSKPFWIMLRAVRDFVRNEGGGALPVRGSIPDMTADSERYVQLFHIYHNEAERHVQIIYGGVQELLCSISKPMDLITESDLRLFCKNAHCLEVIRGRSLGLEYDATTANTQLLNTELCNPESDLIFYVMLRATERFFTEYNRYPGFFQDQLESDVNLLKILGMNSGMEPEHKCIKSEWFPQILSSALQYFGKRLYQAGEERDISDACLNYCRNGPCRHLVPSKTTSSTKCAVMAALSFIPLLRSLAVAPPMKL